MPTRPPAESRKFAVFRADASPAMGTGHVMRALALAARLRDLGWNLAFAISRETLQVVPFLDASEQDCLVMPPDASEEPSALAARWPQGIDLLVVDHYGRGSDFETACRPWAKHIMAIDDLADRCHDCDLLLDPALGQTPDRYTGLVPPGCTLLLGPAYALLRPAFLVRREAALRRRRGLGSPLRLLIGFGGSDPHEATRLALWALARVRHRVRTDVVLGIVVPHREAVERLAAGLDPPAAVIVEASPAAIAELMAQADLALGAAGSSSWERCCLGLPSLIITTADNQRLIARTLHEAGAARHLGDAATLTADRISAGLDDLFSAPEEIAEMSTRAAQVCDGRGVFRATAAIAAPGAKDGVPVTLRPAAVEDSSMILDWQRHPHIRHYAGNPNIPTEAEHQAWYARRLSDEGCLMNIILHGDHPAGMLRLDRVAADRKGETYEVSILVAPAHQRQGVGSAALAAARLLVPDGNLKAVVLPDNRASFSMFLKAGYVDAGDHLISHRETSTEP